MSCPNCGEERKMYVSVRLRMPEKYRMAISKKAIIEKECQITAAFWEEATLVCRRCHTREKGL